MSIRKFGTIILALGIDPRKLYKSLLGIFLFTKNSFKLWGLARRGALLNFKISFLPILSDSTANSGVTKGHYFHQDLWAARRILYFKPTNHIDVGSRLDGFVAHLLVFMNVTVIDLRPLHSKVKGLTFIQRDMMAENISGELLSESVSCLHALEHFGLGRYGDSFDWEGWRKGLKNLSLILKTGGRLYLSVPIGPQVVEFNAQRIFMPQTIIDEAIINGLVLKEFSFIDDEGNFFQNTTLANTKGCQFGCGCFEFIRS
jgi:hypothetical protein